MKMEKTMIRIEYKGWLGKPGCGWPLMASDKAILVHVDGYSHKAVDMNPGDILTIHDFQVFDDEGKKVGWIEAKLKYCDDVDKAPL